MQLKDYSFGELNINGKLYTSDLLICSDKIKANWWRNEGHSLCREDLTWVLEQNPDLLIIGTGKSGFMTAPQDLEDKLKKELDVIMSKTETAVEIFNQQQNNDLKVAAALHLTC